MCAGLQPRQRGTPGQVGWPFAGRLRSCLALWAKKRGFRAGGGVQGAGRDTQNLRTERGEPPGGWQWCEKFTSFPRRAVSHAQVSLPLLHSKAACLCADVMAGLQSEQRRDAGAGVQTWWSMEEGGRRRGKGSGVCPRGFSKPVLSPLAAAPARLSGPQVSSSSGWTSSRS